MESPRFVLIPCRSCSATTLAIGDRRRPVMCARCRAPYDAASASFGTLPETSQASAETPTQRTL